MIAVLGGKTSWSSESSSLITCNQAKPLSVRPTGMPRSLESSPNRLCSLLFRFVGLILSAAVSFLTVNVPASNAYLLPAPPQHEQQPSFHQLVHPNYLNKYGQTQSFGFSSVQVNRARTPSNMVGISQRMKSSLFAGRSSASPSTSTSSRNVVVLTREAGKNCKLRRILESQKITALEIPCIAHCHAEGYAHLKETLDGEAFDYIIITSPEVNKRDDNE